MPWGRRRRCCLNPVGLRSRKPDSWNDPECRESRARVKCQNNMQDSFRLLASHLHVPGFPRRGISQYCADLNKPWKSFPRRVRLLPTFRAFPFMMDPGIRTVVFFKGCPLSCQWCANPECLSGKPQMGFIETLCADCGKCLEVCTNNAIRRSRRRASHRLFPLQILRQLQGSMLLRRAGPIWRIHDRC